MISLPTQNRVLVVDDEPDIHTMTRLNLKGMRFRDRPVEVHAVATGADAVEFMRQNPDTAVMLLDVVMETNSAGLDCCRAIRNELNNGLVRILLRTGQPGVAPERKVIDEYDIDGYLPKAELSATRLYSSVRTAIKAFEELVELERHREVLEFLNRSAADMRAFEPIERTLERILDAVLATVPAPLVVLCLDSINDQGDPRRFLMHVGSPASDHQAAVESLVAAVQSSLTNNREPGPLADGYVVPIIVHRELGNGWIFVQAEPDSVARQALPLLAAHAGNALYSSIAQSMLAAREGPFFESVSV